MKISKELFISTIEQIQKKMEFDDGVNDLLRRIYGGGGAYYADMPSLEAATVTLLADATNDVNDDIAYWLYELDCGKEYKPGMVTDENGIDIPLRTPEDLWNLLLENDAE